MNSKIIVMLGSFVAGILLLLIGGSLVADQTARTMIICGVLMLLPSACIGAASFNSDNKTKGET